MYPSIYPLRFQVNSTHSQCLSHQNRHTSTVGLPRESKISRARMCRIVLPPSKVVLLGRRKPSKVS